MAAQSPVPHTGGTKRPRTPFTVQELEHVIITDDVLELQQCMRATDPATHIDGVPLARVLLECAHACNSPMCAAYLLSVTGDIPPESRDVRAAFLQACALGDTQEVTALLMEAGVPDDDYAHPFWDSGGFEVALAGGHISVLDALWRYQACDTEVAEACVRTGNPDAMAWAVRVGAAPEKLLSAAVGTNNCGTVEWVLHALRVRPAHTDVARAMQQDTPAVLCQLLDAGGPMCYIDADTGMTDVITEARCMEDRTRSVAFLAATMSRACREQHCVSWEWLLGLVTLYDDAPAAVVRDVLASVPVWFERDLVFLERFCKDPPDTPGIEPVCELVRRERGWGRRGHMVQARRRTRQQRRGR